MMDFSQLMTNCHPSLYWKYVCVPHLETGNLSDIRYCGQADRRQLQLTSLPQANTHFKTPQFLIWLDFSGTPLRPKAARVEPHTHTKRRAGNFLWSLASAMTRGSVRTYVAFHDILTSSNFCAASSQWRARNRVKSLAHVAPQDTQA